MIAEYHMACVTRGAPVTSPILPGIIEDKLPPLGGYAPPEDRGHHRRSGEGPLCKDPQCSCMATQIGHGPQWRAGHLWFPSTRAALCRLPVILLPGSGNCLGPPFRGRDQPGPQGK